MRSRPVAAFVLVLGTACGAPTPVTTTATPPAGTTTLAVTTTTTTQPATTTTAVRPLGSSTFAVPFVMNPPPDALVRASGGFRDVVAEFSRGRNQWITFIAGGALDDWIDRFTGFGFPISAPVSVEIGGIPATAVDVRAPTRELLYTHSVAGENFGFGSDPGDAFRLYTLDVDDQAVSILVLSDEADFEAWLAIAESLLTTVQWGVSP